MGNTVVLKSDLVKRNSVYRWYARTAGSRVIIPSLTRSKQVAEVERNPSSGLELDECAELVILRCDRRLLNQLPAEASTGKLGAVANVEADLHDMSTKIEL